MLTPPSAITEQEIAAWRDMQVRMSVGRRYCYRYIGGPADGLRLCLMRRPSKYYCRWHFATHGGAWNAGYTWSDKQAAYVFKGWEPHNPGAARSHRPVD